MSLVIWQPALSTEAPSWRRAAEQLTKADFAPLAEELDRDQRYPWENVAKLVDSRIGGLFILAAYGGAAASLTATIIENPGIGYKFADMAVEISAARLMLYQAAAAYDAGREVANLGGMAELYGSEVAHRADRDQRVLEIYQGTSEIQRLVHARAVRKEAETAPVQLAEAPAKRSA